MNYLRLGDVCEKIDSGVTPRGGYELNASQGVALISYRNVTHAGFSRDGLAYIDTRHAAQYAHAEVLAGDVLLNIAGNAIAQVCQAPSEIVPARVNHQVALIRPQSGILDAGYLRCYLASPAIQESIRARYLQGNTGKALTRAMIASIEVPAMPLARQRAIAHLFGALEDKIALTRDTLATLDALVRAQFISWFVDFDPVHRNSARKHRLPATAPEATDTLFPDRFEDSPLGKMPVGWCLTTIRELASNIQAGLTSVGPERAGTQLFRAEHLGGDGVSWTPLSSRQVSPAAYERYRLLAGDILVARGGASADASADESAPAHNAVGESLYLFAEPNAVFAEDLVRFRFARPEFARFISSYLRTGAYTDYLAEHLAGMASAPADGQLLAGAQLVLPPLEILQRFTTLLAPLDARIREAAQASMRLPQIRAALWAKLFPEPEEATEDEDE